MRFGLVFVTIGLGLASTPVADDPPEVADGYTFEVLAEGLDTPEGLANIGAGQVAVLQSGLPELDLLRRSGRWVEGASSQEEVIWIDVLRDPGRGYFITQNMYPDVPDGPPTGILWLDNGGNVVDLFEYPWYAEPISLSRDPATNDLYISVERPDPHSWDSWPWLERRDLSGHLEVFIPCIEARGSYVTRDRRLIVAVRRIASVGSAGGAECLGGRKAVNGILAIDLETNERTWLGKSLGSYVGFLDGTPDGSTVYVGDLDDGTVRMLKLDDATGTYAATELVTGLSSEQSFNGVVVLPNGNLVVSDYKAGVVYEVKEARGRR